MQALQTPVRLGFRAIAMETIVPLPRQPVCRLSPAGLRVEVDQTNRAVCLFAAFAWSGEFPIRTSRQEVDASSVTPAFGEPAETKKARYVVALSRVLRSIRVFPAFALGRCATTGTCEFGQGET